MASEPEPGLGLTGLVTQLAGDAREVARSEFAVVKARAADAIGRYKAAAIFFAAAGTLGLAALIALLVGLILTLAPIVGAGFATLIVIGIVLLITVILGLIGVQRLKSKKPLT